MTDNQFNSLYNQAEELMQRTKDPVHNWSHVERVKDNGLKIKKLLPLEKQQEIDDKILIIACSWHDISFAFYKAGLVQYFFEGKRATKVVRKYFSKIKLSQQETDLISDVILHHLWASFGVLNKHRSLYYQLVQDADFLDMFSLPRIKQLNKSAKNFLYWKFIKVLKPLFLNYMLKNKKKFLNLEESLLITEALKHKT